MPANPMRVVIVLFPGITHLDFTGPHQFFCRIPGAEVLVASLQGENIEADGLVFSHLAAMETIERCDLLCVPGGFGVSTAIQNRDFLGNVARLADSARYITSICTGSIILAAAGLLNGKRAACHWAWRELLALFPGVTVAEERVVRDGKVFTGGGVTAGIDMALTVIAEVAGEDVARSIQLGLEYAPQPPFTGGRPENSPTAIVQRVENFYRTVEHQHRQNILHFLGRRTD